MKKLLTTLSLATVALALTVAGCKKEKPNVIPEPTKTQTGKMNVQFEYVFGSQQVPWKIGETYVHPKTGDTLTFTLFKYYVSNLKFRKTDGTWWAQPESYFLVDAEQAGGSTIAISDMPEGIYDQMEYTMGVDSYKNVSGVYEGALSLVNGMFWDWNSGFIMLKAEGKSPNAPSDNFAIHLGGFTGSTNVVTTLNTDFGGDKLTIKAAENPTVTLVANPAKIWHSSPGVDSISVIHAPGEDAYRMAKDFYNGIYFKSIN